MSDFFRPIPTKWVTINVSDAERLAQIEEAGQKVIREWDHWKEHLHDIGVEMPYHGSAPLYAALSYLRRSLEGPNPDKRETCGETIN